jgi:hypothetical protein
MAGLLDVLSGGQAPAGLLDGFADALSPGRSRRRTEELRKLMAIKQLEQSMGLEREKFGLQKGANELARERFDFERGRADVPSGFMKTPGGLTYVPGGPADPEYKRKTMDRRTTPAGYRWENPNDPDSNLVPIPGGPGEKIPAEVAARIGLAKSFLGQLEDYTDRAGAPQKGIRARIQEGQATGALDGPLAAFNIGQAGELKRLISSGSEALLRNLTGAGMGIAEASKYVKRYEPEWNDSAATLLSKVDQLERELVSTIETVGKGRGVASPRPTQAPANDGWSVQRIK